MQKTLFFSMKTRAVTRAESVGGAALRRLASRKRRQAEAETAPPS